MNDFTIRMGEELTGNRIMITAAHPDAVRAGLEIAAQGGNVVDAAVATAFALGVVDPGDSGIGGYGGSMLVHLAGMAMPDVVDYNTLAPQAAQPDSFEVLPDGKPSVGWWAVRDDANATGHRAVSVPGILAGLCLALERYGTLPLAIVMTPAIRLAEEGWRVSRFVADSMQRGLTRLANFPELLRVYAPEGHPPREGDVVREPDYAASLRAIAEGGSGVFYHGMLGERIIAELEAHNGLLRMADLETYQPRIVPPISLDYRGHMVHTTLPSGGLVLATMAIISGFEQSDSTMSNKLHRLAEAFRLAWEDRLADVDGEGNRATALIKPEHAASRRAMIGPQARPDTQYGKLTADFPTTTHFCVMDATGNAVTCTQTHGPGFGSGVVVPGTGILLNSGMWLFDPNPGQANSIAPGKRALSQMSPTMIQRDGQTRWVCGTPGGRKIPTIVTQLVLGVLDDGFTPLEALAQPRLHIEDRQPVQLEASIDDEIIVALEQMGHRISRVPSTQTGGPASIIAYQADNQTEPLRGAADPRHPGAIGKG